jgi:scytalone dehydratase
MGRLLRLQELGTSQSLHCTHSPSSSLYFHAASSELTDILQIDYRSFLGKIWEAMPASDFVAMASDPNVLGDPLLMTQHFIGGSRWEKVSDTEVIGYHQLRVPHQRWTDATRTAVAVKGHAHSHNTHWYRKVDGVWKFAGLCPDIRWGEYEFDQVFASGRDQFEEKVEEPVAAPAVQPEQTAVLA